MHTSLSSCPTATLNGSKIILLSNIAVRYRFVVIFSVSEYGMNHHHACILALGPRGSGGHYCCTVMAMLLKNPKLTSFLDTSRLYFSDTALSLTYRLSCRLHVKQRSLAYSSPRSPIAQEKRATTAVIVKHVFNNKPRRQRTNCDTGHLSMCQSSIGSSCAASPFSVNGC